MEQTKKYRNEWKFVCREADLVSVCERLKGVLQPDEHGDEGRYSIHSLYFDDYIDSCAMETEAGISSRYKYRIRYYGNSPERLILERKEKLDGRCYKKNALLTPEQYEMIVGGEYGRLYFESDNEVIRQFCISSMTRLFTPKAIIDYERTAFVEPITNIRITADRNISASGETDGFLSGSYLRTPVLASGQHVLEVKFDYMLPGNIKNIITHADMTQASFSKYYLGRKIIR